MEIKDFISELEQIRHQEKTFDIEINISDIIDKDHLDCIWYGGEVGTIKYKNYTIVIGAYGDIRLSGKINGEDIYVVDKNNGGEVYNSLGHLLDDDKLKQLLSPMSEDFDKDNYLEFKDNNWFEVDLISPEGKWIDLSGSDNVLDDNLLDCFTGIETYFEYVDNIIKEKENKNE